MSDRPEWSVESVCGQHLVRHQCDESSTAARLFPGREANCLACNKDVPARYRFAARTKRLSGALGSAPRCKPEN